MLAAVLLYPCTAQGISAKKAIVMDATTGRYLYEKDADSRSLIASTTKIMTALIVCEQCNVLDRMAIPKEAVGIEGSSIYLKEGEVLTLQELLYGMMLHSGNDAATALAIYCGGTVEGFAQLMNDKARLLGMKDTHFSNPHGLDAPEHYSTARDLAVLAVYAMKNPVFAQTVSTKTVRIGQRSLRNHNKLLWQVEGAEGVKTGYTKAAGRLLVSSTQRLGRRLVTVTIDAPNDWADHAKLINQGFRDYQLCQIITKGQVLGSVQVISGACDRVNVLAAEDFSYPLGETEKPHIILQPPGFVYAPVEKGKPAGCGYICIGDTVVGKVSVVYEKTVDFPEVPRQPFWEKWMEWFKK